MSDAAVETSTQLGHGTMPTAEAITWSAELKVQFPKKKIIVLANKIDLQKSEESSSAPEDIKVLGISAKEGIGIDAFKSWMVSQVQSGYDITQETIITNARHVSELEAASVALQQALNGLETQVSGDFVAMDIRQAMYHLGVITGQISEDDILANIFSKFCIGK